MLRSRKPLLSAVLILGLLSCTDTPMIPRTGPATRDELPPAEPLSVTMLDVGEGDALLIRNGTSRVLVDGGPSMTRFGRLLDSLGLNGTHFQAVVLSHGHSDHAAGLRELFRTKRRITIGTFYDNQDSSSLSTVLRLRDSVRARAARGELILRDADDPCADGTPVCTVSLAGGGKIQVMRPATVAGINNRSIPLKVVGPDSASFTMWLAGDAEREALAWYDTVANYDAWPGMRANVLKGDRHGNCLAITHAYVNLVQPDWTIFSLSATNTMGYVMNQVKTLLTDQGRPWYRTDQNGSITFSTPGTPGGGYSVTVDRGAPNASGPGDRTSTSKKCNPIP